MLRRPQKDPYVDGLETYFAVIYLAPHAINSALLGRPAASGDGRIVQVSGKPLRATLPDLCDLQFERRRWTMFKAVFAAHVLEFLDIMKLGELCADIPVSASIACIGATSADPRRIRYCCCLPMMRASPTDALSSIPAASLHRLSHTIET